VIRNKQHLAAIRPVNDTLVLETMYYADEVQAAGRGAEATGARARVEMARRR